MTDILVDPVKFEEMNVNIFNAIDEYGYGMLETKDAEKFVREFLRGTQVEGLENTDFEE